MIIRSRSESELGACVRILAEVHRRDGYPMRWPCDPGRFLAEPGFLGAWVAVADGRLAGHVVLARPGPGDAAAALFGPDAVMVSRLFVASAARRRGTGSALLGHAAREAARLGLHPVLDVLATNDASVAFYERLGWRLLGTAAAQWGPDRVTVRSYAGPPAGPPRRPEPGHEVRDRRMRRGRAAGPVTGC